MSPVPYPQESGEGDSRPDLDAVDLMVPSRCMRQISALHQPAVGLGASDSISLSSSFFIYKMGILISLCRFGTGEVSGS